MGEDALYRCLMRGLKQNEPPWGERRATPSFEICPYCGTEFGYEDATRLLCGNNASDGSPE